MIGVLVEESKRNVICFEIKDEEVVIVIQYGIVLGMSKGSNFCVCFIDEIKIRKFVNLIFSVVLIINGKI